MPGKRGGGPKDEWVYHQRYRLRWKRRANRFQS